METSLDILKEKLVKDIYIKAKVEKNEVMGKTFTTTKVEREGKNLKDFIVVKNVKNCVIGALIEAIEKKEQQRIIRNEYARMHYQKNKDKYKQKNKKYYEKNKKELYEKYKNKVERYSLEYRQKIKEKHKQYRQKNKEKLKQYRQEYIQKNKDKIRISYLNRRRAKKGLELI